MLTQFTEFPDSRQTTFRPPSQTRRYKAAGEPDDSIVEALALSLTPLTVITQGGLLHRKDVRLDPDGYAQYFVTVSYSPQEQETGSVTFNFDTTGATIHITTAREHIQTYGDSAGSDLHKGAIGVDKDGNVEGADIIIPALRLTYQFQHPQGQVNESHARNLGRNTGKTNSQSFRGFSAGELLFAGATGSDGTTAEAQVSYNLIAQENASGLTFGDIGGIVKQGHHLAWVEFKDAVESGKPATQPLRVHIERVYESVDFASVFGWS